MDLKRNIRKLKVPRSQTKGNYHVNILLEPLISDNRDAGPLR